MVESVPEQRMNEALVPLCPRTICPCSNIERNRNCIFGRRTNWDNLSQGHIYQSIRRISMHSKPSFSEKKGIHEETSREEEV